MATIKDIARVAGVSQGTVSNVLNGKDNVSSDKIQRVMKVVEEMGYAINEKRLEALQRTVSIQTKMLASTLEVITSMITFDHPR